MSTLRTPLNGHGAHLMVLLITGILLFFSEVAYALALSGANTALDQVVQDWTMFSPDVIKPALPKAAETCTI